MTQQKLINCHTGQTRVIIASSYRTIVIYYGAKIQQLIEIGKQK
jgi:hypothetical protein